MLVDKDTVVYPVGRSIAMYRWARALGCMCIRGYCGQGHGCDPVRISLAMHRQARGLGRLRY